MDVQRLEWWNQQDTKEGILSVLVFSSSWRAEKCGEHLCSLVCLYECYMFCASVQASRATIGLTLVAVIEMEMNNLCLKNTGCLDKYEARQVKNQGDRTYNKQTLPPVWEETGTEECSYVLAEIFYHYYNLFFIRRL